jgi:branched-chain amino acid transport system ATP-binding protein
MSATALLEVRDLSRSFGGLRAVADISFSESDGEIKAIIGPNGAGKTTLFNLISGTLRPDGGEVVFGGRTITGLHVHEVAGAGIARTFQAIRLAPGMSVLDSVMLGRHLRSRAGFPGCMLRLPAARAEEAAVRARARELLALFGLADVEAAEAMALSFGRQRAVELARALAAEPRLLLLDEPASGLNIRETEELAQLIRRIRDMGVTVLLVEHDMSLVMDISDSILVLNYGRRIAEGAPREIRRNREVIDIYLGQDNAEAAEY